MSVHKRPTGRARWEVRWREEGRQRSRSFDRKADAQAFDAAMRERAQLGAHAPARPSSEPLEDWLRRWWERDAHGWAASTRAQRGQILDKWVVPFLGAVRLRDLGPARVREWRSDITAAGCSPKQVNAATRVLSAALGAAVPGELPANPCTGIGALPVRVERPRALTPEDVERIAAATPTPRDAAMVVLLAYAGLRPEELIALRWSDLQGGAIIVDRAYTAGELKGTKSGARRTVEIVAPLAADLAAYRPHVVEPDALVAPNRAGGFLDWGNWRHRVWGPAAIAAGFAKNVERRGKVVQVPTTAPYDLRHTYCSLLIHEGRSPLLVAAAMGHASGELVWRRYGHVFDTARLAPAVAMVEAIETARAKLDRGGVRRLFATDDVRVLRAPAFAEGR